MSHIALQEADSVDQQIANLSALEAAVHRVGLSIREGHKFRGYATDRAEQSALPSGFKSFAELEAACKRVISLPGNNECEIGVVASKKFPGTYSLAFDFYRHGHAIAKKAGLSCDNLLMHYHMEASRELAHSQGYSYSEVAVGDGQYDVEIDATAVVGY